MNPIRWFVNIVRIVGRSRPDKKPHFDRERVEAAIGYRFKDPSLLFMSLKHRSYSQAKDGSISLSNERLEFLGDSVLNMVVAHHLFKMNPTYQEGDLTKLKSTLVSKTTNALAARKVGIDRFILLSNSEEDAGGRERASIIADTSKRLSARCSSTAGSKQRKTSSATPFSSTNRFSSAGSEKL